MTHTTTLTFGGISIQLECHYLPAIPSLREATTGLPVEPDTEEEFEILRVRINGEDAWDLIDKLDCWEAVEEMARERI